MRDFSGRLGEIWEYAPGVFWALEFTPGGEVLHRSIPLAEVNSWFVRLQVPASGVARRHWRERFPLTDREIRRRASAFVPKKPIQVLEITSPDFVKFEGLGG